jgi:hypothetical protein
VLAVIGIQMLCFIMRYGRAIITCVVELILDLYSERNSVFFAIMKVGLQ